MVRRQVVVEGRVVEELGGTPLGHVGLLVGQFTAQRDYVCMRVPTPPAPVVEEPGPTGGRGKGRMDGAALSELEDWWLLEHARQVTRVLPGGLEVVGLFVTMPPDAAKGLYPRLRLLLEQLRLVCSPSPHPEEGGAESALLNPPHTNCILLQTCPTTGKCTVKTVDIGDKRSAFSPCEAKFQDHSTRWHTLRCVLNVRESLLCPVLERRSETTVLTQLKCALSPYLSSVVRGEVVCGGEVVDRSGQVVPQNTGKQKGAATTAVGMDLYLKQGVSVSDCSVEHSPSVRVGGCVVSSAVVPPRATWADAERAIKSDVLRSLLVRVDLLGQEISRQGQEEEDPVIKGEEPVQWGFPRRVAVTMDSTPFPLSDYCFEDESDKECAQRVAELLSVADWSTLEVTSVEGGADLGGGDSPEEEGHEEAPPTTSPTARKGDGRLLGITGAILTAGIALIAWWWAQSSSGGVS